MTKSFLIFYIFFVLCANNLLAQEDLSPVDWHIYTKPVSDDTFQVFFDAYIDDNWMIYSSLSPDGGPIATSISFDKHIHVEVAEGLREINEPQVTFEKLFGQNVMKFTKKASFSQLLKSQERDVVTKGYITYMACNGKQCLPPTDIPFLVVLN